MSLQVIKTTLYRDLSGLFYRRTFWWALALWSFLCSVIFFGYLEQFLERQSQLRTQANYQGVTDVLIVPYINMLGLLALIFISSSCSRLFHHEHFSRFAIIYRSTNPSPLSLLIAKFIYVALLSLLLLGLVALPMLVAYGYFDYHLSRVMVTISAQFVLSLSVGFLAMTLSQYFRHSVLVMLTVWTVIVALKVATALITAPFWVNTLLSYFSPLSHIERIAMGVVTLSNGVFFLTLWLALAWVSIRQFKNTYCIS